jgi:hypothetical protein
MNTERWGTLSVRDHKNISAFITDIILYDRLVIPIPPDQSAEQLWHLEGRRPDLLKNRLDRLGDLAEQVKWRSHSNEQFRSYYAKLDLEGMVEERRQNLGYQLTRRVLAQEYRLKKDLIPNTSVTVVSAYTSEEDFEADMFLDRITAQEQSQEDDRNEYLKLGVLLRHKILVPYYKDKGNIFDETSEKASEKAFEKALNLVKNDEEFKASRQEYYKWQEDCMNRGYTPKEMEEEMDQMILMYGNAVRSAGFRYVTKFATAIIPIIAPVAISGVVTGTKLAAGMLPDGLIESAQLASHIKDAIHKIRDNPIHTPNGDVLISEFIKKGPMVMANVGDIKPAYTFYAPNKVFRGNWAERLRAGFRT